jgi:hypothetical protein
MMQTKDYTQRIHSRIYHEVPIQFAAFNTEDYRDAITLNSCANGMYFESNHRVSPDLDIYIKMVDDLPIMNGTEAYNFYRAKVIWCRDFGQTEGHRYGAGVQYKVKRNMACELTCFCSLCGENIPCGKIHKADEFVYLCPDCLKKYQSLYDKKAKASVEDLMIGNVL